MFVLLFENCTLDCVCVVSTTLFMTSTMCDKPHRAPEGFLDIFCSLKLKRDNLGLVLSNFVFLGLVLFNYVF